MNITLTIDAPELASALNNLAIAMGATGNPLPAVAPTIQKEDKPAAPTQDKPKPETKPETKPDQVKEEIKKPEATKEEPATEPEETEAPGITLEVVRKKLAEHTAKGKPQQTETMKAIQSLGVKKLTDVDPADYGKLLEAVGLSA